MTPLEEYASLAVKCTQLQTENERLRRLLVELLAAIKEVEINLQKALDKDCK
jgi:hypothetical protein